MCVYMRMHVFDRHISICMHPYMDTSTNRKKIENNNNKKKVFDRRISICMHPYMDTSTNRNIKGKYAHTYSKAKTKLEKT